MDGGGRAPATHAENGRVEKQVADALRVLDYAIQSGFRTPDGQAVPTDVVTTIEDTAAKLGVLKDVGTPGALSSADWVQFELAYYRLSTLVSPVTAQTLLDTERVGDDEPRSLVRRIFGFLFAPSPAQQFTRKLLVSTIAFLGFVVAAELLVQTYNDITTEPAWWLRLLKLLTPYAYGGLGACVFLLKSAHTFIHQRCFDVRRKPEYLNRVLLGTIAGGAIILFVNQVVGEDGAVVQLSSAALGFLAGYSTDFLFSTIERVIAAILPKVGLDTVRRAEFAPRAQLSLQGDVSLKDLTDRHDKATDPADKDFYKRVIDQLSGAQAPRSRRRS